ncbi:MAG: NADH-quinone oxidoreductase subunit N [Candidatus Methanomethylophilaceae archaeon]|jgi:proton-translocating NADH-quinone oxidoreductase chain N
MVDIDISWITNTFEGYTSVLPLVILLLGAVIVPGIQMAFKRRSLTCAVSLITVSVSGMFTVLLLLGDYSGMYYSLLGFDAFSGLMLVLFHIVAFLAILISGASREVTRLHQGAYYSLLMIATAGMGAVAMATDLLVIFVGVEMVSIPSYALTALKRKDPRSAEAALKYVVIGGLSSGLTIYGISMLFGLTGTTNIFDVTAAVSAQGYTAALVIAVATMVAGYGFKIAAVPFHTWAPDVYEGAATPVSMFLASGSKKMGIVVYLKIFLVMFVALQASQPFMVESMQYMFAIMAAVTMTVGNVVAIVQNNIKRMLAYSSIAQAGYMLMVMAIMSQYALTGAMYYMFAHVFMKGGAFIVVAALITAGVGENISDYRGLAKRSRLMAAVMLLSLLSLAGIPPLGGFTAKFFLFSAAVVPGGPGSAVEAQWIWLAFVAILNSAISLYYYARVIKAMYIEKGTTEEKLKVPVAFSIAAVLCVIGMIILGVYPGPLFHLCMEAAQLLTV